MLHAKMSQHLTLFLGPSQKKVRYLCRVSVMVNKLVYLDTHSETTKESSVVPNDM